MKITLLISALFFCTSTFASSWKDSFYTDDSAYFLKLKKDGFKQRFRIKAEDCNQIVRSEILFKHSSTDQFYVFKNISGRNLNKWPSIYGTENSHYCWFEVEVDGLNLNSPQNNQYVIKLLDTNSKTYYFQGISDSLLPKRRITEQPVLHWIDLGQEGSTPVQGGGVYFKVWEPLAEQVHLFVNDNGPFIMFPDNTSRVADTQTHVMYIPGAKLGDRYHYKFVKDGKYETLEVNSLEKSSDIKVDPMAKEITYERKGGELNGYLKPEAVVTETHNHFSWKFDDEILKMSDRDYFNWLIYQVWPLSFNPPKVNGEFTQGTFNSVTGKLDYLSNLGINTVEFLPVHESRFHASWGYALDSLMLIEKTYGSRAELSQLIDNIHAKKLKVILDVVINHVNNSLLREPLSPTKQSSKFYSGNTDWGPKPRFSNVKVRKWIADSLISLIRDHHVDGYRFDMTDVIFRNDGAGYQMLQELNALFKMNNSRFYSTAEQLPDNVWATYPLSENGLGFDAQWNDKFKNAFELEFDHYRSYNRGLSLEPLKAAILGYSDHNSGFSEHHFGPPSRTVNYVGSHDFIGNKNPIIRLVSDYEEYEWEGKNFFFRVKPLYETSQERREFRKLHNDFTHSTGKLAYGIVFTKPGAALFFQGEELANDLNIENEWSYLNAKQNNSLPTQNVDVNRYVTSHRVPWEYLNPDNRGPLYFLKDQEKNLFTGYTTFFKDLIRFKKENPEIDMRDPQNVAVHYGDILTYELITGTDHYFVIANFGHRRDAYWINFPGTANSWWEEVVNSSDIKYGGSSKSNLNIISYLGGRSNHMRLGPTTFMLFKMNTKEGSIKEDLFLRSDINNWEAKEQNKLVKASDRGDIFATELHVPSSTELKFKLGTRDWQVELGQPVQSNPFSDESDPFFGNNPLTGSLTYMPMSPNVAIKLEKGTYKFLFNIKTFTFNFIKIH